MIAVTDSRNEPPKEAARYGAPAYYVDSESPEIEQFVVRALSDLPDDASQTSKAIRLFDAVRDGIRYDPYTFALDTDAYRASRIAKSDSAFCVPKAILLAACLRAVGIPAALGFADVRNHLNTPKLQELMGTDLFIYHGYVQLWVDDKAYKITPAFDMDLCRRFGVKPLVFNGESDALLHEFNANDLRHMEYVNDRGLYLDAPVGEILCAFKETYPKLEQFSRDHTRRNAEGVNGKFAPADEAS